MSDTESNRRFTEELVVETPVITEARQNSIELGIEPIAPSVGAQIAVVVAATAPTSMIEIGTGAGVSGLWLASAAPQAVLTTIDVEAQHQQSARASFSAAGIPSNRVRFIAGRALDVLPRMNENSYDVVLVDADAANVIEYVEHGLRLVRAGGTVLVPHVLWRGRVADPAKRDDITVGYRTLLREIGGSDAAISAVSPVGDGLLQLTMKAS